MNAAPFPRRALLGLPPLLASTLLAACADPGPSGDRESSAPGRGAISAAGGQAMLDAQAALARCMREQGIDVPDPRAGGGGFELDPGADPALEQRMRAAEARCENELRAIAGAAPTLSASDRRREVEAGLRFARCMRSQGQDVPDPSLHDEGGGMAIEVPPNAKSDPAFDRAARRCERP